MNQYEWIGIVSMEQDDAAFRCERCFMIRTITKTPTA